MNKPLLFLDFDGVICDSVNECFVSSWLAYQEYRESKSESISLSDHALFRSYRPLIRRGADYLLLQQCIDKRIRLSNQTDFDAQEDKVGEAGMDAFHEKFYGARRGLLEKDRNYWLSLNCIYEGIYKILTRVQQSAWILTTKEVPFVVEILRFNGLEWNSGKIICSGKESKAGFIEDIIGEDGKAIFVDDQIDHFSEDMNPRISCYLASWGYVQPEWLGRKVDVLTQRDFVGLVEQLI